MTYLEWTSVFTTWMISAIISRLIITSKKCPICEETYSKNIKYCFISKKFKKDVKISYLIDKIGEDKPLIIYVKSQFYDFNSELYQNIKLSSFIKKKEKGKKDILTIYDSLELFNKEEIIIDEENWFCNKCDKQQKCQKKLKIYKAPYYLIIHLKRFKDKKGLMNSLFGNKNEIFIDYQQILNLNDYVIGPDKENSIYYLYGVICHKKLLNGNHYISFCKIRGQWLTYDDEQIEFCENPINKDGYLLFYKRKNI